MTLGTTHPPHSCVMCRSAALGWADGAGVAGVAQELGAAQGGGHVGRDGRSRSGDHYIERWDRGEVATTTRFLTAKKENIFEKLLHCGLHVAVALRCQGAAPHERNSPGSARKRSGRTPLVRSLAAQSP